MRHTRPVLSVSGAALLALAGCSDFDVDLRNGANGFSTTEAARQATADRPQPDARGVITYPDYQVAVARRGDTVASVAQRLGLAPGELARHNALTPDTTLRAGEVLALPRKVADDDGDGDISVTALAEDAIDRAEGNDTTAPPPDGPQPTRHRVRRGETAFQIARLYDVSPRALADWNGLDPEMRVREGQVLLIPVAQDAARDTAGDTSTAPDTGSDGTPGTGDTSSPEPDGPAAQDTGRNPVSQPGAGSATPEPPSASAPLPDPEPSAAQAEAEAAQARPDSPELGAERSESEASASFAMPVDGRIIRAYDPGRNDGIGIGASAGTTVRAARAGTVAAITETTSGVTILVLAHADNLLSVYANITALSVDKGARVAQGDTLAQVAAGDPSFLHFEIRNGQESVDPMQYLN